MKSYDRLCPEEIRNIKEEVWYNSNMKQKLYETTSFFSAENVIFILMFIYNREGRCDMLIFITTLRLFAPSISPSRSSISLRNISMHWGNDLCVITIRCLKENNISKVFSQRTFVNPLLLINKYIWVEMVCIYVNEARPEVIVAIIEPAVYEKYVDWYLLYKLSSQQRPYQIIVVVLYTRTQTVFPF